MNNRARLCGCTASDRDQVTWNEACVGNQTGIKSHRMRQCVGIHCLRLSLKPKKNVAPLTLGPSPDQHPDCSVTPAYKAMTWHGCIRIHAAFQNLGIGQERWSGVGGG